MRRLTRRQFTAGILSMPLLAFSGRAQAAYPRMLVTKDPNCGCCNGWVDHLRANGFSVDIVESSTLDRVKDELGVPEALRSCHTAKIGGYVIEGHVPADAIRRLLTERPKAAGLAVPGMPASSPGMDIPGARDVYDVILFDASGQSRYARYQGLRQIAN